MQGPAHATQRGLDGFVPTGVRSHSKKTRASDWIGVSIERGVSGGEKKGSPVGLDGDGEEEEGERERGGVMEVGVEATKTV